VRTFKSDIDLRLWLPVGLLLAAIFISGIVSGAWPLCLISGLVAAYIAYVCLKMQYTVTANGQLQIRCSFLYRKDIDIASIRHISYTNNPLSAPAASLRRLELRYNKRDSVLISPKDRDRFVKLLASINPAIEIKGAKQ
jgi:hypothetical protein